MTNTTQEHEAHQPQKPVRIILSREVRATPELTAELLDGAIMDAAATRKS